MGEIKRELTRINMNLPVDLVEQVKKYASEFGINTTSAFTILVKNALEQQNMLREMPKLINTISELKDIAIEKEDLE